MMADLMFMRREGNQKTVCHILQYSECTTSEQLNPNMMIDHNNEGGNTEEEKQDGIKDKAKKDRRAVDKTDI